MLLIRMLKIFLKLFLSLSVVSWREGWQNLKYFLTCVAKTWYLESCSTLKALYKLILCAFCSIENKEQSSCVSEIINTEALSSYGNFGFLPKPDLCTVSSTISPWRGTTTATGFMNEEKCNFLHVCTSLPTTHYILKALFLPALGHWCL